MKDKTETERGRKSKDKTETDRPEIREREEVERQDRN